MENYREIGILIEKLKNIMIYYQLDFDSDYIDEIKSMYDKLKISEFYDNEQLKKIKEFIDNENYRKIKKFIYDNYLQDEVSELLKKISNLSKTFDHNIKNERKNITSELKIFDKKTGESIELVDINSMSDRVRKILDKNDIYACLKSLALSNKCAHKFDGDLDCIKSNIEKYYNSIYYPAFNSDIFSFMEPIEQIFPLTDTCIYDLEKIDSHRFNKIYNVLFEKEDIKKGAKINTLKWLDISFDIKNEEDINLEFEKLKKNREKIVSSYLIQLYKKGQNIVLMQSKMFAIKDSYIAMIGQLLKKDEQFKNLKHELIKTPDAKSGFEYMLVIDDNELQYYIEVHMPNFIANSLMKKYGLVENKERKTQKLGASAVYARDKNDIKKLLNALKEGTLGEKGQKRAEIITRGCSLQIADSIDNNSKKIDSSICSEKLEEHTEFIDKAQNEKHYCFVTDKIEEPFSLFEKYIIKKCVNLEKEKWWEVVNVIEFNRAIQKNENYPTNLTKAIALKNYYNIYANWGYDEKESFIKYAINKLSDQGFEKIVKSFIVDHYDTENHCNDIDFCGNVLINKDELEKDFVIEMQPLKEKINDIKHHRGGNKIITEISFCIFERVIEKYFNKEKNKENNNDKPKK